MRNLVTLAALGVTLGLSGCATVVSGTKQRVGFDSTPQGATAKLSSGEEVKTPGQLELSRSQTYDVIFEKDGYVPAQSHIGQTTNSTVFGNILLGGLIGMIVDSSTGAAYDLHPAIVSVTLVAKPEGMAPASVPDPAAVPSPLP